MSARITPPKIDPRKASDLLRSLREMAPHYTREWSGKDEDDPGVALLKIFSFIGEGVISRLNRAPERNFLAFLDMLGIRLLQARPARASVTFLVANGTEFPFLVLKGTQVSAPPTEQHPIDLPFETDSNLLVVPSLVVALISVDPERDSIYRPPPGFLEPDPAVAATELPQLTVIAFSAAQSKFLQLDPPDQVKPGDFLRIDQKAVQPSGPDQCVPVVDKEAAQALQSEHLVVADVKGTVVTLSDPLERDYVEGTRVRKVTQFELFEGKSWQEHILYLGHSDYFAMKSEAQITLTVQHAPSASSNLAAFNVVWEFYGVPEADKDNEGWHLFQLDADGTAGFSTDGVVALTKPPGEIKETEINGKKSRWIRARLEELLPATPPPPLPKIESITLAVSTGGKDLQPDKAFHNDTPLTTAVPFFPFGTEPRIFDRFSIASEEAFSKPNAEVTLTFNLDATDLLAAPAATVDGEMRVFAHAAAGRLLEFRIDPRTSSSPTVKKHDTPPDTRITAESVPAVVSESAGGRVGAFVKADDGKIYLRFVLGEVEAGWQWIDLAAPTGELQFNPAAVLVNNIWHVFVVAGNQLFSKTVDPISPNQPTDWTQHLGGAQVPQVNSTPLVLNLVNKPVAFVTDVDGRTWKWDVAWIDLTPLSAGQPDPAFLAAENARPYALPNAAGTDFRIFLRSISNHLVVIDTDLVAGSNDSYGPPTGTVVDSNPSVSSRAGKVHAYVRGADNRLWSIEDPLGTWASHLSPSDHKLASDPLAVVFLSTTGDFVSVFSASDKNSLLEFRARGDDVNAGTLRAGPLDIVVLDDEPQTSGTYFINITDGPGKSAVGDTVRELDAGLSRARFGVLGQPLVSSSTTDTTYDLLLELASGNVQSASNNTVELEAGAVANIPVSDGDFVFVGDQIRQIPSAPAAGDTVTVDRPWSPQPGAGDTYHILHREGQNKKAAARSIRRAVLEAGASNVDDDYKGLFLEITSGPGQIPGGREIANYLGATRSVVMQEDFSSPPDNTSDYRLTVSSISSGWFIHREPDQTELRPELSWEYWNGRGFVALAVNDTTENFLHGGVVEFTLPEDIGKTEVAGQENFWIRARIVGGDYGRELFSVDPVTNKIKIEKDPIRPPLVKELSIKYDVTELKDPQFCLTLNNLNYIDQTAANLTADKHFFPFVPLADTGKALYFGLDRAVRGGPIKIYFPAKELEVDERNKPKLKWEFAFENDWKELLSEDGTQALTRSGFVSLNVPDGFQNSQEFGRALFWLRATLIEGDWNQSPLLSGVFINTVEALQARTVTDEILGSSTGVKNQSFRFQQLPVIENEEVRVREALTEQEREQIVSTEGADAVFMVRDQDDRVLETWIRWTEVIEFFDSTNTSRHYRLDRHTGEIEFGDGVHGRIPPAGGDNIRAFRYQAGGGRTGNVAPGEINTPVTAVGGVDAVINPVGAGGGSEAATNEEMLVIGPAQISHRDRAVTPDDFERLALEASREVRKAKCLSNRNRNGRHELGWTTVHIVPDSADATPQPSLELRRAVQRYLSDRADVTLVAQDHIFVGAPEYVPVSVEATVFAKSLDVIATAEQNVKKQLESFLHPLKGGPNKEGWDFGRDIAASDLYSLLEDIEEVDHVGSLRLLLDNSPAGEQVAVAAHELIASGTHRITMNVANGE